MAASSLVNLDPLSEQDIHACLVGCHRSRDYYQNVGSVLVKINPYPQFSLEPDHLALMRSLLRPSARDQPSGSGIYRFAESIRRAALDGSGTQLVVFRGMNGAGKSEAMKMFINYLSFVEIHQSYPSRPSDSDYSKPLGFSTNPFALSQDSSMLSRRLCAAMCLVTAFTTASTDKNSFSSRTLKLVSLKYGGAGNLAAMRVRSLFGELLRTSPKDPCLGPLLIQAMLIRGSGRAQEFGIGSSVSEAYSNVGFHSIDLAAEFNFLQTLLLQQAGLGASEWTEVLQAVAAVCLLQAVTFIGTDSTTISSSTKNFVSQAEQLIGVESGSLFTLLMKKPDDRIGRPSGSVTETRPAEARAILDSLCAYIVHRALAYLLDALSVGMPMDPTDAHSVEGGSLIHLLDPTGWEKLGVGQFASFSHLIQHYIEERLNQVIIQRCFRDEFDKYIQDGVQLDSIPIPEWHIHLEALDKPLSGILAVLDDNCIGPRNDEKSFVDKVFSGWGKSKLVKAGGGKSKATVFTIRHSFLDVTYDAEGFVAMHKNGHLPASAGMLLKTSTTLRFLYQGQDSMSYEGLPLPKDETRMTLIRVKSDSRMPTTPHFFWNRSKDVYNRLLADCASATAKYFVLCLALTAPSASSDVPADLGLTQIRALALESLVQCAQKGFAYINETHNFYQKFRILVAWTHPRLPPALPPNISSAQCQAYCRELLTEIIPRLQIEHRLPQWSSLIVYGQKNIFIKDRLAVLLEEGRFTLLKRIQAASLACQARVRMVFHRRRFLVQRNGVVRLQSLVRCRLQRYHYQAMRLAAVRVQSFHRMRVHYLSFQRRKRAVNVLKRRLLGPCRARIRYKRLIRAGRAFQTLARGFLLRKHSQHVYSCLLMIQRYARLFIQRRRLERSRMSAILKIQQVFRGYKCRTAYYNIVQVLRVRKEQRIGEKVIRKLQALWRAKMVVRRFQEIFNATLCVQAWMRCVLMHLRYKRIRQLTLWLQSHARRLKAFKFTNALKVAQMLQSEKGALATIFYKEMSALAEARTGGTAAVSSNHASLRFALVPPPPPQSESSLALHAPPPALTFRPECVLSTGVQRQGKHKYARCMLSFDLYFDLSFAYPDGWLLTVLSFQHPTHARAHPSHSATAPSSRRSIVKMALGSQHTVLVDDKWDVYTFGLGDVGQLGHSNRGSCPTPRIIELLPSILAATETSGGSHKPGSGRGGVGGAGIGIPGSLSTKVEVKDVCCGKDHTLLLTASGRVYSWGDNRRGQLGHSYFEISSTPRLVGAGPDKALRHVTAIGCGAYHSVCLADPGVVYVWGAGDCLGRLVEGWMTGAGMGASGSLGGNVGSGSGGMGGGGGGGTQGAFNGSGGAGAHATALSASVSGTASSGKQRGWHDSLVGDELFIRKTVHSSKQYRLFDATHEVIDCCEPCAVPFFTRKKVRTMCCGESHITVQCGDTVYAWGKNSYGQLGTGTQKDQRLPTKIHFRALAESEVHHLQLLCGGRHMMMISKGKIWLWGWNKYGQVGDGTMENAFKPVRVHIRGLEDKKPVHKPLMSSPRSPAARKGPGLPSRKTLEPPQQVHVHLPSDKEMGETYIRSATIGWRHSIVMTAKHRVFGWGVVNALPTPGDDNTDPFEVFLSPTFMVSGGPESLEVTGASGFSMSFSAIDRLMEETGGETGDKLDRGAFSQAASSRRPAMGKSLSDTNDPRLLEGDGEGSRLDARGGGRGGANAAAGARLGASARETSPGAQQSSTRLQTSTKNTRLLSSTAVSMTYSDADLILERFRREVGRLSVAPKPHAKNRKQLSGGRSAGAAGGGASSSASAAGASSSMSPSRNRTTSCASLNSDLTSANARDGMAIGGGSMKASTMSQQERARQEKMLQLRVGEDQLLRLFTPHYDHKTSSKSRSSHAAPGSMAGHDAFASDGPYSQPSRGGGGAQSASGAASPGKNAKTKAKMGVLQNFVSHSTLAPASLTMMTSPTSDKNASTAPSTQPPSASLAGKPSHGKNSSSAKSKVLLDSSLFPSVTASVHDVHSFQDQMRELGLLRATTGLHSPTTVVPTSPSTPMMSAADSVRARMGLGFGFGQAVTSQQPSGAEPFDRLKLDLQRLKKL